MSNLFFFIRTLIFTFVVVLLLQIRFGEKTAEDYTMDFLTSSSLIKPVNQTADKAVIFIRNMLAKISRSINTNFVNTLKSENQPGSRQSHFIIKRKKEINKTKENTAEFIETFKKQAVSTGKKISSSFIDETKMPGRNSASDTRDDEILEE
ncbi:MAG: hypothetical protein A2Z20_05425 [Bdellovibrionales bacterium RBG_16_40_8]|nr:MAG: hypothetical protein A2Z20_05425 [Bdellovibrionales bacterium RBG_16_40_8]